MVSFKNTLYFIGLSLFLCLQTINVLGSDDRESSHPTSSIKTSTHEADHREFVSEKLADDLYLCYQPVKGKEELMVWIDFVSENMKVEYDDADIAESKKLLLKESHGVMGVNFLKSFLTSVPGKDFLRGSIKEYSELAIVYAANRGTPLTTSNEMIEHIEMVMASHTSSSVPFITHIGINRPPLWIRNNKPLHKGLSRALHSFGARRAQQNYPDKDYMFTAPLPVMRSILEDALPASSIWVIDPAYNKTKNTTGPFYEEGGDFVFRKLNGEEAFRTKAHSDQYQDKSGFIWFFAQPTIFGNGSGLIGDVYFTFVNLQDLAEWGLKNTYPASE